MYAFLKGAIVEHTYQKHILGEQHAKQLLKLYKRSTKHFSYGISSNQNEEKLTVEASRIPIL